MSWGKQSGEARSRHVRSRPCSRQYAYPRHNTVPITTSTAITIHLHRPRHHTSTARARIHVHTDPFRPPFRFSALRPSNYKYGFRPPLTMDAYPPELVAHETPLLLVSGLGTPEEHLGVEARSTYGYPQLAENGTRVTSSVPPVTTPAGELLLLHFLRADSAGIWAGRTADKLKSQAPAWRVRAVGRVETPSPTPRAPPSMILTSPRITLSPRGRPTLPQTRAPPPLPTALQTAYKLSTRPFHLSPRTPLSTLMV